MSFWNQGQDAPQERIRLASLGCPYIETNATSMPISSTTDVTIANKIQVENLTKELFEQYTAQAQAEDLLLEVAHVIFVPEVPSPPMLPWIIPFRRQFPLRIAVCVDDSVKDVNYYLGKLKIITDMCAQCDDMSYRISVFTNQTELQSVFESLEHTTVYPDVNLEGLVNAHIFLGSTSTTSICSALLKSTGLVLLDTTCIQEPMPSWCVNTESIDCIMRIGLFFATYLLTESG